MQKPLFQNDRWTDRHIIILKPVYPNFIGMGITIDQCIKPYNKVLQGQNKAYIFLLPYTN